MVKVENRQTLRLLTKLFMKMNKSRNIIAVIAIMLTALLFTSLFMGTASLILSKRATDIKQFMDSSHAIAQDLSYEEALQTEKAIKKNDNIERFGTGIFLGAVMDERFGFSSEVRYADKNLAESFNCTPTEGRLPENKNEIAVSTIVLNAMGVEPRIGQEITLTWESDPLSKKLVTDTFRICGFWQGDKAVMSQMIWVSEEYAAEKAYPVTKAELENGILNGGRDCCVWYKSLWDLQKKTEELSKDALIRIITEPKNAILKQYKKLFAIDDVELEVEDSAIERIAEKAIERKTGARGLRGIMEDVMHDIMYEIPSRDDVEKCVITKETIDKEIEPKLLLIDQSKAKAHDETA